jgi:hypothetical protein
MHMPIGWHGGYGGAALKMNKKKETKRKKESMQPHMPEQ